MRAGRARGARADRLRLLVRRRAMASHVFDAGWPEPCRAGVSKRPIKLRFERVIAP